jgi:hypothetical protein
MKRIAIRLLKVSVITGLFAVATAQAELVRNPTQVGTSIDLGQVVSGSLWDGQNAPQKRTEYQVITRTGVYLTESAVYNERLTIQLSIGGLFWFALPETPDFQDRRIQFGPGVGQAQGIYAFGADPRNPAATLQFGLFPFKYSDAVNLGEYLYRSGTYPGTLTSGGWSYINAASYMAQGINLTVPMLNGQLTHNLTLFLERDLEPTNDLSPGYMITYKPTPFLEIGAGIVWAHAISLNSDRLAPETEDNAYSKTTKLPIKNASDSQTVADGLNGNVDYYTFRGFKTAARASLDIGMLLGTEAIKPGDFKLYTEVALLGIEDQPYFYDKKTERMPVMVGLNIPTFGLLDRLSGELEYRASPFPNSNQVLLQSMLPVPVDDPYAYDPSDARYNDIKWTVYARRSITEGVSIYAQAASDHLRHFNRAAVPGAEPATPDSNDWYYVLRLEFGI